MDLTNVENKIMKLHEMCEEDAKIGAKVGLLLTSIEVLGNEAMELVSQKNELSEKDINRLEELDIQLTNLYGSITILTGINLLEG